MLGEKIVLPALNTVPGPYGGVRSCRPLEPIVWLLVLVLSSTPHTLAAPPPAAGEEAEFANSTGSPPIRFSRHVLDNGLIVLLGEEHTLPLVSVLSWYRSGARYEVPGITGIAHYLEHMAFRDTVNLPPGDVTGFIERLGGHWHGYTRLDNTAYYETARREALDWLLFLEAERMSRCRIRPEEVEVERGSMLSELRGYENNPWSMLFDDVAAIAFREHPYRLNISGWVSDLEAITHADIVDFYDKHYVPANAVLTVVGDFDTDEALAAVHRAFDKLPGRPAPEPLRTREPPQRGEKRVAIRMPGSSAHVLIAHHAPAFNELDFYPFLMLDGLLSGGRSLNLLDGGFEMGALTAGRRTSRLYRDVVRTGLATRLSTGLLPSLHPYLYTITAEAAPGVSPERLERGILESLERLAVSPPPPEELAQVRERLGNLMRLSADTYQEVAHMRAGFEALGATDGWGQFEKRLAEVTPERVQAVARRTLIPRNRTVGVFIPQATATNTAGERRASRGPEAERRNQSVSKRHGDHGSIHPPAVLLAAVPPPIPFSEARLESGLVLRAAENSWAPTASLVAEIDAGPLVDPSSRRGTAALTARLLAFGSAELSSEKTASVIDRLGLRWRARVGGANIDFVDPRKIRIEIEFAARDLEHAAALLAGALRDPVFPRDSFNNALQAQINAAAGLGDDSVGLSWNGLWSALYDGTPLAAALPASGHEQSLSSIRAPDLRAFHRRHYRPERARIAFSGSVPVQEALRILENAFTGWKSAPRTPEQSSLGEVSSQVLSGKTPRSPITRLEHKTRVEIAYGFFTGIETDSPDYPLFEALWYVVQHGYYAGRLGNRIVGQRGLAYSVESHHAPQLPGSPMFMATGAAPEDVGELKKVWEATLDEVASDGISPKELAAAKTYLDGRHLHERESNLAAARMALIGEARPLEKTATFQEITLKRVNDLARRLLHNRLASWSLAGPTPPITP